MGTAAGAYCGRLSGAHNPFARPNYFEPEIDPGEAQGEVSQSDFDAVKPGVDKEIADIEAAKKALEMKSSTMSSLIEAMRFKLVNLVDTWREGGMSDRCELQNALFPEGLPYSSKHGFFEPGKSRLINQFVDMLEELWSSWRPQRDLNPCYRHERE